MPIGATCLARKCGQAKAGLNTNETLNFFFFRFRTHYSLAPARLPLSLPRPCMPMHAILFLSSCSIRRQTPFAQPRMSRIACAKSIFPNTSRASSVNASVLSLHGHYRGVSPSDPNCSFLCRCLIVHSRWVEWERERALAADMPLLSVCARVSGCVGIVGTKRELRSERQANEPHGHARVRVGVIRSSIDSYERTVLAHRRTIAANFCCTGLGV